MYRLVIAEKPSVAMSIAKVLGAAARKEGRMEGRGSPVATSKCQRHLEAPTEPTGETGWLVSWCTAILQTVERREKSEKPPALYDLTTLQRDANRTLGYTAQQTLDYLQALYEKKLCTYPRTDSRYLTDDMENAVPMLVSAAAVICGVDAPETVLASQVCSSKNVTDHHAVVPTKSAADADLAALPQGEREILRLVSLGLLQAVCPPHRYAETSLTAECGEHRFTAKGKAVLPSVTKPRWRRETRWRAGQICTPWAICWRTSSRTRPFPSMRTSAASSSLWASRSGRSLSSMTPIPTPKRRSCSQRSVPGGYGYSWAAPSKWALA